MSMILAVPFFRHRRRDVVFSGGFPSTMKPIMYYLKCEEKWLNLSYVKTITQGRLQDGRLGWKVAIPGGEYDDFYFVDDMEYKEILAKLGVES